MMKMVDCVLGGGENDVKRSWSLQVRFDVMCLPHSLRKPRGLWFALSILYQLPIFKHFFHNNIFKSLNYFYPNV